MKALILAAGYATRLYPLTKEYPKPLLLVEGRPIVDYIIDKLEEIPQIDEIIIVTNSKFISKFRSWKKNGKRKARISLVDDQTKSLEDRRGAIGDMAFAILDKKVNEDLLVVGGDNLFAGNLGNFVDFAKRHSAHPAIGVYDIGCKSEAKKYGVIKLDSDKRIIDFKEKPRSLQSSTLVAMCLYYFPKKKLELLKEYMETNIHAHDATGFYIDWLRKKETVFGYIFEEDWFDIGDHKFYNKAKKEFIKK